MKAHRCMWNVLHNTINIEDVSVFQMKYFEKVEMFMIILMVFTLPLAAIVVAFSIRGIRVGINTWIPTAAS